MDRQKTLEAISENKLIVVLRNFSDEELINTVAAIYEGGGRLAEVAFDASGKTSDEDVAKKIRLLSQRFSGRVIIGAGTVLTEKQVDLAADAGAEFIISPDVSDAVIRRTREKGLVSVPGAFTPTEAVAANRAGADFVKLFPCGEVKPSYLKAICLPLSHIKFLAVGGVDANNAKEYLAAGAAGVGVASAIADKQLIARGDYKGVTALCRKFIAVLNGNE